MAKKAKQAKRHAVVRCFSVRMSPAIWAKAKSAAAESQIPLVQFVAEALLEKAESRKAGSVMAVAKGEQ